MNPYALELSKLVYMSPLIRHIFTYLVNRVILILGVNLKFFKIIDKALH